MMIEREPAGSGSESGETEAMVERLNLDRFAELDASDLLGRYIEEVSQVPLLTAEEEVKLAKQIKKGRKAREKLGEGTELDEIEKIEFGQAVRDEWKAVDHLITANTRLVISVAKKYMGRGVPFIDLIQEGNIGLMRAAKKFDCKRGCRFSTYAVWWIRQAVTRAIADQGRTIRIPVHRGDQINRMFRTQYQLRQDLGRDPSRDELAGELNMSLEKLEYLLRIAKYSLSLEMPVSYKGDAVLGDFIPDPNDGMDEIANNLLRKELAEVMEELPAREARVLRLRYGIPHGKNHTLQAIGNKIGVSRERVRQIEAKALRRLRNPRVRKKLG